MKKPLLNFKEEGKDLYYVYNHEKEFLGVINRSRVGRFLHWIFCPQEQTYYTNGCLKEIDRIFKLAEKQRKVGGKRNE